MTRYALTVAPNGARRTHANHPALPVSVAEIARTAAECQAAGAQEIHLHVRDDEGRHSLDPAHYRRAMAAVNSAAPGLRIQITTESAGRYDVRAQLDCLAALRPAAASISVREMARDPQLARQAYALCAEAGTLVQHILYGPDCIRQLRDWYADGIIPATMRDVIFVLGSYTPPAAATPADLQPFLDLTRGMGLRWTVCAFGANEQACLLAAIAAGGHVRVGFENNIETPDGEMLPDNAASVAALVKSAQDAGYQQLEY